MADGEAHGLPRLPDEQRAPLTSLTADDFKSVIQLPKELREDRWEELGGLYGIRRIAEARSASETTGATPRI